MQSMCLGEEASIYSNSAGAMPLNKPREFFDIQNILFAEIQIKAVSFIIYLLAEIKQFKLVYEKLLKYVAFTIGTVL